MAQRVVRLNEMILYSGASSSWLGREKRTSQGIPWSRTAGLELGGGACFASDQEQSRHPVEEESWGEVEGGTAVDVGSGGGVGVCEHGTWTGVWFVERQS